MKKSDKNKQLGLNLQAPDKGNSGTLVSDRAMSDPVCLNSYRSNQSRKKIVEQLEKSGLVAWKQSKLEA